MQWCRDGNENSAFLHQSIKARRLKNNVYAIQNNGVWKEELVDVNEAFLDYYKHLLGSTLVDRVKVKKAVINMGPRLTNEHIHLLERPYTAAEVKTTLFSIETRSLGHMDLVLFFSSKTHGRL